jgi:hypothetical protein
MFRKLHLFTLILGLAANTTIAQNSASELFRTTQLGSSAKLSKSSLTGSSVHDHAHHNGEKCLQHSVTEQLMESSETYREGVLAAQEQTNRIIAEIESGTRAVPPVYTIPIVFHIIHKGESVGSGTNISDAQVLSAVEALNRDYRRTNADGGIALGAGPDTEIQFCLASVDPSGNPTSGINRVNGSSVSGYAANGITTGGSGNELAVKALSNWDNRYYLNIWVVTEIQNNGADLANPNFFSGGILGFAYLPIPNIQFLGDRDGVVALNLCVGNDPTGSQGFRLWSAGLTNRTLTHEVGHYLGLAHPFSDSNPSACSDGDGIGDTPNAQQANIFNCNATTNCSGQMIENYMDYAPETCQNRFTNGQNNIMRGSLAGARNLLVNTNNCTVSSNDFDAGISAISNPSENLCSTTFTPTVTLTNYGSTTLTSVEIDYYVDSQSPTTFNWSGNLASGSSVTVTLNSVTTTPGNHTFTATTVSGSLNGSNTDEDNGNNATTTNFNVGSGGTQVTLTLDLDCYGSETTWEVRNSSNQVEVSGGPYTDTSPNGEQIVETFCLSEDCYDFTIFDSFTPPDGMSGAQYQGCDVNGDYEITDGNSTLVEMTAPNADFGGSATHNFCIGGGSNPGTPSCSVVLTFDGEEFQPATGSQVTDGDGEFLNQAFADFLTDPQTGVQIPTTWYVTAGDIPAPGDTNWYITSWSYHQNTSVPADNWLTFGPVAMGDDDGEFRWKHRMWDDDFRDGYRVLVGTAGLDVADFSGADVVYSVTDNDPSTVGQTTMTQQSVSLPANLYANQDLYFAIHHNSLNMLGIDFDDIEVEACNQLTVGVAQTEDLTMNVFPNPSNENFTLTYAFEDADPINFELFNTMGQRVWSSTSSGNNSGRLNIETADLSGGIYTLVARNKRYNNSKKLILTK